jgi:hypothetical protein
MHELGLQIVATLWAVAIYCGITAWFALWISSWFADEDEQ